MRAFLLKDEPHPFCMRVTLDDRNVAWWLGWTRPFVIDLIFFIYISSWLRVQQSIRASCTVRFLRTVSRGRAPLWSFSVAVIQIWIDIVAYSATMVGLGLDGSFFFIKERKCDLRSKILALRLLGFYLVTSGEKGGGDGKEEGGPYGMGCDRNKGDSNHGSTFFSQDYGISVLGNYERRNFRKWMMMNHGSQQCISLYVTCTFRTLIGTSGTQSDALCRECSRLLPD
ncbi:hypothetical protein BDV33DRAFT_120993 [Aspergillus novoparasiticus]|uniref:Uncharacterized protein n=1 Tax=Aspergillus novoparasiticus TaxID=986946 RepID=A0A5N6ENN1_9EURO|nr:hypothetical protein BDV33DRAFT_120993 [Aspergillus novoparasiticus]